SVKPGSASNGDTFAAEPVTRLSTATTWLPRSRRLRHRCEPMNPAPPDTTDRGARADLVTTDPPVDEAEASHQSRIIDVATVDQHRAAHHPLQLGQVQVPELVPLGDHHHRVGAPRDRVGVASVLDLRHYGLGLLD